MRIWYPWWMFPFVALAWLFVVLPIKIIVAAIIVIVAMFRGPRERPAPTRIRIIVRDHEKSPARSEDQAGRDRARFVG